MTYDELLKAVRALARRQARNRELDATTLRRALAETCLLMAAAPTAISDAYHALSESDLADGADAEHDRLDRGDWAWAIDGSSPERLALGIGVRARGLDRALAHEAPHDGPADDPDVEYYCADAGAYVVPRAPTPWQDGQGSRRFFARRGTPFHRIIPKTVGSFVQELHRLDGFDFAPGRDRPFGAAMFENFRLLYEGDGETFRVLGIECPGGTTTIDYQVSAAYVAQCSAVVWPELTMPPAHRDALTHRLEEEAYATGPAQGPAWVLAGSWNDSDPAMNVAPVLDGYGGPVFEYAKSIPYRETGLGREEMQPGYRVPILVTDRALVAFGICRDFCELGQKTPWSLLNVDYVVVPSMGDETTMQSHRTAAHLGVAGGQRALVVQQRHQTETGATGWVLPPTDQPGALELSDLVAGSWSEHPTT